jgi:hypothetical protein
MSFPAHFPLSLVGLDLDGGGIGSRDRSDHFGLVEEHALIRRHIRGALLGGSAEHLGLEPRDLLAHEGRTLSLRADLY